MQEVVAPGGIYNARHTSSHSLFNKLFVISCRNAFGMFSLKVTTSASLISCSFCLEQEFFRLTRL